MDDVELIAVCRRTNKRPSGISNDCAFYTNYETMMDKERLDGVIAAVSPFEHPSIVLSALKRHLPILIEKPLALNEKEMEFLNDYPNAKILINYIHLYADGFMGMTTALKDKKIKSIKTEHTGSAKDRGFSSLFDYGTHDLSICMKLTGILTPICQTINKEGKEIFNIEMRFGDIPVYMRVGNGGTHKIRRFETLTDCGTVLYDGNEPALYQADGMAYGYIGPLAKKPLGTVIEAFINNQYETQEILLRTRYIIKTLKEIQAKL